jgi:CDP-diglyceride synthetase
MDLVQFFLLIWPPYVANGSAVFAGRLRRRHPLDFGRRFRDGRRIFGDGKTFEGLAIGTAAGTLLGYAPQLDTPIPIAVGRVCVVSRRGPRRSCWRLY